MLHVETSGRSDINGGRVVLLHGFTQTCRAWNGAADAISEQHEVFAIDAPGHGGSATVKVDLPSGADMMAAAVPAPATWVGYSMGGRYALHVALRHPQDVERLVLVSTTAGIDDAGERHARRESDEALAEMVEREGVEEFVAWWLRQPIFATLGSDAAALDTRLDNTPEGLASSLRLAGAGTQEPLWSRLRRLDMPVLVVAGELDAKYVALGERLVREIGANARLAVIEGAGHACHLEQRERFLAVVIPFLTGD